MTGYNTFDCTRQHDLTKMECVPVFMGGLAWHCLCCAELDRKAKASEDAA